jgi:ATP-dependent Lon protease
MSTRLPVFPLPVVLFPGTPLPLHIFEPRYRELLSDCLAADRRFGITPSTTDDEAPEPGMVGCTAEVRVNQLMPDGRSNIVVLGGDRFVVTKLLDEPKP